MSELLAPKRIYKMTRLGKGDWLLPSNDAQTLWRICSYEEDGSADITGTFWNLWRWDGGFPTIDSLAGALEMNDWTMWELWDSGYRRRADVVNAALAREAALARVTGDPQP